MGYHLLNYKVLMYNSYFLPGEIQTSFRSWNEHEIKMVKEIRLLVLHNQISIMLE